MKARVQGKVYKMQATFDDCLCSVPETIVLLEGGQVVARYGNEDPDLPYDTLIEFLEEHAQGTLTADDLRARLQATGEVEFFTAAALKQVKKSATEHWGSFAVKFTIPSVGEDTAHVDDQVVAAEPRRTMELL